MFEKALITRIGDRAVDLGTIAETMLFYGSTHLLLNRGCIASLATLMPTDDLLTLITRDELRLSYLHQNFGVVTTGHFGVCDFVVMEAKGTAERPYKNFKSEIQEVIERAAGTGPSTRKLIRQLCDHVALYKFKGIHGAAEIGTLAKSDVKDPDFLQKAARTVLRNLLPESAVPNAFSFSAIDVGNGLLVDTDLNFKALNEIYHQNVSPEHSSLTIAYILSHIIDARAESYFAADYLAEIVTTPVQSELIQLKHFDFLRRRQKSADSLELFTQMALPGMPTIREHLNNGDGTLSDFLKVADQAKRFRTWLQEKQPDTELLAEYIKASTADTWADKLPTKYARWAVATGLGLAVEAIAPSGIATTAGLALSAVDAFYLDSYLKGWRPNQFIEGPYKGFVGKDVY